MDEEQEIDAEGMMLIMKKNPELGMEIVVETAEEVVNAFTEGGVGVTDLDAHGRNLFVFCTVILYMHKQYVLSDSAPKSKLH